MTRQTSDAKTQQNAAVALQRWLRQWVDKTWIERLIAENPFIQPKNEREGYPPASPIEIHCQELPTYLAQARPGDVFDQERFWDTGTKSLSLPELTPYALWSWKTQSSRIFELDPQLQALLLLTSYDHVIGLSDLHLPFESFAVQLAHPLHITQDRRPASQLLFYRLPKGVSGLDSDHFCIHVIEDDFAHYVPIQPLAHGRIHEAIRKKSLSKVQKCLIPVYQRQRQKQHVVLFTENGLKSFLSEERRLKEAKELVTLQAFRLVIGLVLYLSTLPPTSPHRSLWRTNRIPKPKTYRPVFLATEVCNVTTEHWLGQERFDRLVRHDFKPDLFSWSVEPHFRRAHERREPGRGRDPLAPRTVEVRSTLVRGDLLPEGTPTPGSRSRLS
jgi:hypothetical protein